jgi:hypothetical protein
MEIRFNMIKEAFSEISLGLMVLLLFFFGCMPTTNEKRNEHRFEPLSDINKYVTNQKNDSLNQYICTDFLKYLYGNNNLSHPKEHNTFVSKTYKKSDSLYTLKSETVVNGHKIIYTVSSKKNFQSPFFLYFDNKDYLKSDISIDGKVFNLDKTNIQPSEVYKNTTLNQPLTLAVAGGYDSFNFMNKKYLVFQGYSLCGGSHCRETFLLIFEIYKNNTNLFVIGYNEYHPFSFSNIFFGDGNKDGKLDMYYTFESDYRISYVVKAYTFSSNKIEPIKDIKNKDYYIYFSCAKCSGDMRDTLTIMDSNWW